jgi:lipopolysaccharide transport system ATP-binding protein
VSVAAVRFEDVSVRFVLHHLRPRSFQDAVVHLFRDQRDSAEEFWALQKVSFELERGETLGIVGQNGSGKSTLLKLITRILEPTHGTVSVKGAVAALIELGAGFHPDLTGRENIYLNGSILGYGRKHMDRLFDEIVAFSELERFIDTPVKHYSSGMYARLGFSVATSVNPDLLLVDEVLSVGDEAFQRKCMNRMQEFRRAGKSIIFVSHSLDTVEPICDQVIWLDHGSIRAIGSPGSTIRRYRLDQEGVGQVGMVGPDQLNLVERSGAEVREFGAAEGAIKNLRLHWLSGEQQSTFETGDTVVIRFEYTAGQPGSARKCRVDLGCGDGTVLFSTENVLAMVAPGGPTDVSACEIRLEDLPLLDGNYEVVVTLETALASAGTGEAACERRVAFEVRGPSASHGIVAIKAQWIRSGEAESVDSQFTRAELSARL